MEREKCLKVWLFNLNRRRFWSSLVVYQRPERKSESQTDRFMTVDALCLTIVMMTWRVGTGKVQLMLSCRPKTIKHDNMGESWVTRDHPWSDDSSGRRRRIGREGLKVHRTEPEACRIPKGQDWLRRTQQCTVAHNLLVAKCWQICKSLVCHKRTLQ